MAYKFGTKQVGKPTPAGIATLLDFFAGLCGIVAGFLTTANFIPHNWSDPISTVLTALFIPVLLYMKKFFAIQIDDVMVDAKDVTEMKEPDTKP
jgi:hypothetical protein